MNALERAAELAKSLYEEMEKTDDKVSFLSGAIFALVTQERERCARIANEIECLDPEDDEYCPQCYHADRIIELIRTEEN